MGFADLAAAIIFLQNSLSGSDDTVGYFVSLPLVVIAAYYHAHRLSVAICYGLIVGYFLSALAVYGGLTPDLRLALHTNSLAEILGPVVFLNIGVTAFSVLGYQIGSRQKRASNREG